MTHESREPHGEVRLPNRRRGGSHGTLYRQLQGFDDRSIQDQLTIPRLCFAGSADTIDYGESWGDVRVDLAGPLVRERDTLARLGWHVRVLEGLDHTSAMQPDAVLPILRPWLSENLL